MRLFVLCCLLSLAGCVGSARIEGFAANGPDIFLYSAHTNAVMTANDDGVEPSSQLKVQVWVSLAPGSV